MIMITLSGFYLMISSLQLVQIFNIDICIEYVFVIDADNLRLYCVFIVLRVFLEAECNICYNKCSKVL